MHPSILRFFLILIFSLTLSPFHGLTAQSAPPKDTIPVIDMRGISSTQVSLAAIENSRNDVIVAIVRGGGDDLFSKAKAQMDALAHQGYTRIGLIRSDLDEGEVGPVLFVGANGTVYAAIKRAEPTTKHMVQFYNLVKDAYEEFILPKTPSVSDGGR